MHNEDIFRCRICGALQDEAPWGDDGVTPSFNICDCCGVEFGYEDCTLSAVKKYREFWLTNGGHWISKSKELRDWSLEDQLEKIPEDYK